MGLLDKAKRTAWFATQFLADGWRYVRYCSISPFRNREAASYYKVIIETHSLEKGLAVANTRPGFGKKKIRYVIDALKQRSDFDALPVQMAVGTLQAYVDFHAQVGHEDDTVTEVKDFLAGYQDRVSANGGLRRFGNTPSLGSHRAGDDFLTSRFSSRQFDSSPLSDAEVAHVVNVAQSAPSQCNRQATKVYFFRDKAKITELLALQAGAGGFAQDVSNLFVVASELSAWGGAQQRNQPYVDGALFCMSLLLACHANDFASCPLNLAITHSTENKIKRAAGISDESVLIMMIAVGHVPDVPIKAAKSPRRPVHEVLTIGG